MLLPFSRPCRSSKMCAHLSVRRGFCLCLTSLESPGVWSRGTPFSIVRFVFAHVSDLFWRERPAELWTLKRLTPIF